MNNWRLRVVSALFNRGTCHTAPGALDMTRGHIIAAVWSGKYKSIITTYVVLCCRLLAQVQNRSDMDVFIFIHHKNAEILKVDCFCMVSVWLSARIGLDRRSYSTPGPVSVWLGDRLRTGKPKAGTQIYSAWAIPPWVDAMSTQRKLAGINMHTTWCTSPCPWSSSV